MDEPEKTLRGEYPDGEIKVGNRVMINPFTNQEYIVSKWVEFPNGSKIAVEKEPFKWEEVEE